jgi:hypothetical protein
MPMRVLNASAFFAGYAAAIGEKMAGQKRQAIF